MRIETDTETVRARLDGRLVAEHARCWAGHQTFRLEFGAGLIKLRGDPCRRDLTCLYYHHETQPLPALLSWFFHHLPGRCTGWRSRPTTSPSSPCRSPRSRWRRGGLVGRTLVGDYIPPVTKAPKDVKKGIC